MTMVKNVGALKSFCTLTCSRYEHFFIKNQCLLYIAHLFLCTGWEIFKTFISFASQIMEEEIYCQNIGNPSNSRLKFLYQIASLGTDSCHQKLPKS